MTIANTAMLAQVSVPSDSTLEGNMPGPVPAAARDLKGVDAGDLGDARFWSLLHQKISSQELAASEQATDFEGLIGLPGAPRAGLDATLLESGIPQQWIAVVKAHFAQGPLPAAMDQLETITSVSMDMDAETIDPAGMNLPTLSALPPPMLVASAELSHGEELPVLRQTPAPPMTPPLHTPAHARPDVPALSLEVPVEEGELAWRELQGSPDHPGRIQDLPFDKLQPRQVAQEQGLNLARMMDSPANTVPSQPVLSTPMSTANTATPLQQSLPAALQTLQLAPSQPAAQWGDAIAERVSFLVNQRMNHAEIRIDPPHLGKLDIQIQVKDDSALVVIQAQHAQTRDLIDQAGYRLREVLQEAGYSSVDVNVSHREQSSAEDESLADGERTAAMQEDDSAVGNEDSSHTRRAEMTLAPTSRIDFFA